MFLMHLGDLMSRIKRVGVLIFLEMKELAL
jgi:hypothetical protein